MIDSLLFLFNLYKKKMQHELDTFGVGLDLFHFRVLKSIQSGTGCTPQMIAAELNRDKAQITRSVNDLVRRGYVVKTTNPVDGRSVRLSLSPEGVALAEQNEAAEVRVGHEIFKPLTGEEITALEGLIRKLAASDTVP